MALTPEQVKGRIKSLAKKNNADARLLIRIYMMERFLERLAVSKYADNFIIKGGILVTSMVGIAMRSTMDVDTTLRNINLSDEDAGRIVNEICAIDLEDDISFRIKETSTIMDEMEYPGIRIIMDAEMGKMVTPIKIDLSTGDVITPGAIEYNYKLMLEERTIRLWSYNLETILSEKLQTVMARGVLNTRMRDFYDIRVLLMGYAEKIDTSILRQAFHATCQKRETLYFENQGDEIIGSIESDENLINQWKNYQHKYPYAADMEYLDVLKSVKILYSMLSTADIG